MSLSDSLIKDFIKATAPPKQTKSETTLYGTVTVNSTATYVKIDGSDILTPATTTSAVKSGDRVTVIIKNHTAVITGNVTNPSASSGDVDEISGKIGEYDTILADVVTTDELNAQVARIDELYADNVVIKGDLSASKADIDELKAKNVTIEGDLTAAKAEIETLKATTITTEFLEANYAKIKDLEATNAVIHNLTVDFGDFKEITTTDISAINARIDNITAGSIDTEYLEANYAQIDFANIGTAAIEQFFAKSGMIKDLIIGEGTVTGELVGVTISGDLIKANTLVADKLVIKGEDGLYYKLNTDGVSIEAQQTEYNSLNGSVILAKSITATKISVSDLYAFDATIGGFKITENSIYSGAKTSVSNLTRGVYLDNTGQVAFGDGANYLKYYKDTDGSYKLDISAKNISFGSNNTNIEDALAETVVDTIEEFYQSISSTSLAGGTWATTQPVWTEGKYIWRRTKVTYGDGRMIYTPTSTGVCITGNTGAKGDKGDTGAKGADGATGATGPKGDKGDTGATGATGPKGDTGAAGKGITKSEVYYYLSTSNTTQTGGSWSTKVPAWVDGRYYWQKIKTTYTDSTTSESTPVCITGGKGATGPKGDTGAAGSAGAAGTGVASITTEFYLSTSNVTQTGGSWVTTMPTWSSGKYLWTRNKIIYKNPTSTAYTTPVCDSSWEAVNEIEVSGRNILWNSDFSRGIYGWTIASTNITYTIKSDTIVGNYLSFKSSGVGDTGTNRIYVMNFANGDTSHIANQVYSLSFYAKATTSTAVGIHAGWVSGIKAISISGTTWKRYTVTYTPTGTGSLTFYIDNANTEVHIAQVKLEKGNKATDWSPSPEDIQYKINEAAKTATLYMNFDSSRGLEIGNKTSGSWSGFRTQITGDSFNILNQGGTVVASYGINQIDIGKNSATSKIGLCAGQATIQYITDSSINWMEMFSNSVRIRGKNIASIYCTEGGYDLVDGNKSFINVTVNNVELGSAIVEGNSVTYASTWLTLTPDMIKMQASNGQIEISGKNAIYLTSAVGTIHLNSETQVSNGELYVDSNVRASSVYTSNWFRSTGATGWYSQTYGGGIYMADSNWVRVYGGKNFFVEGRTQLGNFVFQDTGSRWMGMYYDRTLSKRIGWLGPDTDPLSVHLKSDAGYVKLLAPKGGVEMETYGYGLGFYRHGDGSLVFRGASDYGPRLGSPSYRFYNIYLKTDPSVSSDIRVKTNIKKYDERFEKMFMDLKPITYELNEYRGQSHCGLIAQWVKESMDKYGIEEHEFGAYQHDKYEDSYSIAYSSLTSLNMHMIQKTIRRVDTHDEEIAKLKNKVSELQSKLNAYILGEMEVKPA